MSYYALIRVPKPNTEFRRYNDRLALFHHATGHLEYWRQYWAEPSRSRLIAQGRSGNLGEFENLITRYVPQSLPVLEAGCGPAHLVAALQARGYKAIGIDYEPEVVQFAGAMLPDLDVRQGDVLSLEFTSGMFGCYLSVGVVEHFIDGPELALQETRRVLHPQGVALISVPYLNPHRSSYLRQLSTNSSSKSEFSFHQYYYSIETFTPYLENAGLKVIDTLPYAVWAFVVREHPLFSRLWHSRLCHNRLKTQISRFLSRAPMLIRRRYGHMIMFVCTPMSK